jgi:predicted Zn-dependent protease
MLDEATTRQVLAKAIAIAKKTNPKAEAFVTLSSTDTGNTRFAVGEITSSSALETQQLSVTIKLGKRVATAAANQLDDKTLADVVARAGRMAALSPENPEEMPVLGPQTYKKYDGRDAATAKISPVTRGKAAAAVIAAGAQTKTIVAGNYNQGTYTSGLASTAGLFAYHALSAVDLSCTARTPDGTGSGWASAESYRAADIDAAALAKIAVDKAVRSAKPTRLEPGRYTVVLEPAAVGELMVHFTNALDARSADEGRSFFSKQGGGNKIGEKLFPDFVTLRSDPTDRALYRDPFDGEGMPRAPTTWVDKGVVKALPYSRYWGQKQGKQATAAPSGWQLEGGKATRAELVKGVKRGVLVTRFWYTTYLEPQTILVTGLTRDGVFLIENGEITRPVNNFRFNESPVQMLARCDALSVAEVAYGMRVPALRTHEFNLASISEAV